jgi:hypothetical protein
MSIGRLLNLPFVIAILFLVGCKDKSQFVTPLALAATLDSPFATAVNVGSLNARVQLELTENNPHAQIGSHFEIWVENVGDEPVIFPYDWGIQLYDYVNGGWRPIMNRDHYGPNKDIVLAVKGPSVVWQNSTEVWPDIENSGQPTIVRIVVVGKLGQESKTPGQSVGAYLDVTLTP